MYLGVDVGLTGAVAFLRRDGTLLDVADMPTMASGKGKKQQVNPAALVQLLRERAWEPIDTVTVEWVSTHPKQGVASQGSLMRSLGIVEGVVAALGLSCRLVTAQVWKKVFCLSGAEKDASRALAQRLYPNGRTAGCSISTIVAGPFLYGNCANSG